MTANDLIAWIVAIIGVIACIEHWLGWWDDDDDDDDDPWGWQG